MTFRAGAQGPPVTLDFGPRLRPVYVLGCGGGGGAGAAAGAVAQRWQLPRAASPAAAWATAWPASPFAALPPSPLLRSVWAKLLTMEMGRDLAAAASSRAAAGAAARAAAWAAGGAAGGGGGPEEGAAARRGAGPGDTASPSAAEPGSAWRCVQLAALSKEAAVVRLPRAAAAPLTARVAAYFARLRRCEVYLLGTGEDEDEEGTGRDRGPARA